MRRINYDMMIKNALMQIVVPLAAMGLVAGCASMPMDAQKVALTCDEQADSAVEQGNWQEAFERHEQLLRVAPHNCLAMYHLGYIWGKLEDRRQEVAWYEKAIECGYTRDDRVYFNLGMAYADLNQMDKAIAALGRAKKVNPQNVENHFGLALIAQTMGNKPLAERSLAQAVAVAPNHWDARILLAKIYLDQGRMDAARTHLEWVLNHDPENEAAMDLWRLYQERVITAFEH